MIVPDVNVLIYAMNSDCPQHERAWAWWESAQRGPEHLHVMERLLDAAGRGSELISDAHLAALAVENGGTVYSADADFARFPGVRWVDPLAG